MDQLIEPEFCLCLIEEILGHPGLNICNRIAAVLADCFHMASLISTIVFFFLVWCNIETLSLLKVFLFPQFTKGCKETCERPEEPAGQMRPH